MKPWISNLIFVIIELTLVSISFVFAQDTFEYLLNGGDFTSAMYSLTDMIYYIHKAGIAIVILSLVFLLVKPLRTKFTCFFSICNILWYFVQVYFTFMWR